MSQAASAGPGSAAAAALCEAAAAFASAARASFAPQAAADLRAEGTDAASALAASLEAALGQPEGVRCASSAALECAEGAWAAQVEGVGWASPAWREAFVVGACLAAAEEAAAGGTAAALRRLDVACIMGAPQELLKGLVGAVLDAERDAGAEKEVEERGGEQGGRRYALAQCGPPTGRSQASSCRQPAARVRVYVRSYARVGIDFPSSCRARRGQAAVAVAVGFVRGYGEGRLPNCCVGQPRLPLEPPGRQ